MATLMRDIQSTKDKTGPQGQVATEMDYDGLFLRATVQVTLIARVPIVPSPRVRGNHGQGVIQGRRS